MVLILDTARFKYPSVSPPAHPDAVAVNVMLETMAEGVTRDSFSRLVTQAIGLAAALGALGGALQGDAADRRSDGQGARLPQDGRPAAPGLCALHSEAMWEVRRYCLANLTPHHWSLRHNSGDDARIGWH